jgi:ubiquinone/menaquinone biosynthesis C-methylase UbiE
MKITNWDNHWREKKYDPLEGIYQKKNWSDFQWLHSLYVIDLEISRHIENNKSISMLECGAGTASVSRFFNKKYNLKNVILDNSIEALKIGEYFIKNDNLEITSILSEIKNMPFDDSSFDIVYLGGVMEYLEDLDLCILEIKRVLKPGGLLIFIVVPNVINIQILGNIFLFFKNIFNNQPTKLVPSNVKKWYANKYINKLKENGFTTTHEHYLNPFPQIPLPGFLKHFYIKLIYKSEAIIKNYNLKKHPLKSFFSVSFIVKANKLN